MQDMLVKLYDLPALEPVLEKMHADGIMVRRVMPYERLVLGAWTREHFGIGWSGESESAFARMPISCFIAVEDGAIIGFGCYDCTTIGFFGPMGVAEEARGRGVGSALLLACLHAMRAVGYGYGIIGGVGPAEFYAKTVGAVLIPDSTPGIFPEFLKAATE